jgi:ClpP class serine protease
MSFGDFIWVFIIIFSLLPWYRQRMLQANRYRTLRTLEQKRGSRVITLIHRQESISLLGIPLTRYIDIDDSEHILRAIRLTPDDVPIDIILHTPGGLVLAAEQISLALRSHPAKVTVFVPHYAMSGGTLLALSADEIVMDENAVLGPVDPQIGSYPAVSILRAIERKNPDEVKDETLILGDIAQKAMKQVYDTVFEILEGRMERERAQEIARALTEGRWTHDYPLVCAHLRVLGIAVCTDMPREVYQLMEMYQQPGPRRPSVNYIPIPYETPGDGKNRK